MNKPISEKICEFRKARSLTQAELGERLGVSSQAVSKWEKGESLPDILILPQLCGILGVTSDALLEVPTEVRKDVCMSALADYAKEVGRVKGSYEAVRTCAAALDDGMERGSVYQSYDGVAVCTQNGIGLVIDGEDTVKTILRTDYSQIRKTCELLMDENTVKIIGSLDFSRGISAESLAGKLGITPDETERVLFRLMRLGYCECDANGDYILGGFAYSLLSVLLGMFLSSPEGHGKINSISRNFLPRNEI